MAVPPPAVTVATGNSDAGFAVCRGDVCVSIPSGVAPRSCAAAIIFPMLSPLMRLVLAATVLLTAITTRAAGTQTAHVFEATITKSATYPYLQWLPRDYHPAADRTWPLLLFLHGAGERGTDVQLVARHGPPKLLSGAATTEEESSAARPLAENFIVISPQCPLGQVWDDDAVLALLDSVCREQKVDRARVYLTGLSMGGYGTWSLAMKHPQRFAAVVPICGGGRLLEILISRGPAREALQTLGVWAFHGAQDPTVPVAESERMIDLLRRVGVKDIDLTIYPEAKHDSWTATYANAELYAWLLRHIRRG